MRDSEDYFNRLLELRRLELKSRTPVALPPDFYEATRRYLQSLEELLSTEIQAHPTSPRTEAIHQLRQRAVGAARDLMEWRMEKISQRAYKRATQGEEPPHLLPEEQSLLAGLSESVLEFGHRFTPYLFPPSPPPNPSPVGGPAPTPPAEAQTATADTPRAGPSSRPVLERAPASSPSGPLVALRILKDGPSVLVGPEESVDLHAEDLLLLPLEKANILVRSGHAEAIHPRLPLGGAGPVKEEPG